MQSIKVIRPLEARAISGTSKTRLWELQKEGLMVSHIKIGHRATGFLEHEIQTLLAARAAGYDDEQIKVLVQRLENQRKEILGGLLSQIDCTADAGA
jgi:prophage regulatory protein